MVSLSPEHLADLSLSAFETVVGSTPGFRPRPGQHEMAACVAATLARADLGEHPAPTKAIAVRSSSRTCALTVCTAMSSLSAARDMPPSRATTQK
jgi:ATP-dependent DNA helicase DinG